MVGGPEVARLGSLQAVLVCSDASGMLTAPQAPKLYDSFSLAKYLPLGVDGQLVMPSGVRRIWLDIGAHQAETTRAELFASPDLAIIAFEPSPRVCSRMVGFHPRLFPVPAAVGLDNGWAEFHVTENEESSSLRAFDPDGLTQWADQRGLGLVDVLRVPVVRLDSILNAIPCPEIEFVKIDAQGSDLDVVLSAGAQISRISRLTVEVTIALAGLYSAGASKPALMHHLEAKGFRLVNAISQTNGQEENLELVNVERVGTLNQTDPVSLERLARMSGWGAGLRSGEAVAAQVAAVNLMGAFDPVDLVRRLGRWAPPALLGQLVLAHTIAWQSGDAELVARVEQILGALTIG